MKKRFLCTVAALMLMASAMSGCSLSGEPDSSIAPVETASANNEPSPAYIVYGDYALLPGHAVYQNVNNAYSIQLPEGCNIDDTDPNNVTISVATELGNPNMINIRYSENEQVIDRPSQLYDKLAYDDTIDITGIFTLSKDGAYEGYKYTSTKIDSPNIKSITSVYFSDDRSAYTVTATSEYGNDEINMTNLNTIVDTFVNYN